MLRTRSGDPEQQYLSDGIAEDNITETSRFRDLLVIATMHMVRRPLVARGYQQLSRLPDAQGSFGVPE
jgi:TolB-like protein